MEASELLDDFVNTTQKANMEVGRAGNLIQKGWTEYKQCETNKEEMLDRVEGYLDDADQIIEEEEGKLEGLLENRSALKRMSTESGFGLGYTTAPKIYDELKREIEDYRIVMKSLYSVIDHERLTGNF